MKRIVRVTLEGTGTDIELTSCRVAEYHDVRRLAIALLDVANEEALAQNAAEIVDRFAPGLPAEELTMNDLWEILMAKAGTAQGEVLRRLPEIAAEKMVDFLRDTEVSAQLLDAVQAEMRTTGES